MSQLEPAVRARCRACSSRPESSALGQHTLRKAFTYTLQPTATQERELERVLGLCWQLYNGALQQRITAWVRRLRPDLAL